MCTLVFIPQNNKLIFASLRDESPTRPTEITPELYNDHGTTILAPKDGLAGGTWLGVNDYKNVLVLLNGAFEKHNRQDYYRKSRGLVVKELLTSGMPVVDWELINLVAIEPFTLVLWSNEMLFTLVWDGIHKHRFKLDSTIPHIFSSSTLYNAKAKQYRQNLFQKWISLNLRTSPLSLLNFFRSYDDKENGFIINRNEKVKTLSYSYIELNDNAIAKLSYYDLQNFSLSSKSISIKEEGMLN